MRYPLTLSAFLWALIPIVWSSLQPSPNARQTFALEFCRRTMSNLNAKAYPFIVSPAAIQKLLIVIYNGVEDSLAEDFLWDLHVKHVNWTYIKQAAAGLTGSGADNIPLLVKQETQRLRNQTIAREDVLKFFENDFTELNGKISYQNDFKMVFKLPLNPNFVKFAESYFGLNFLGYDIPSSYTRVELQSAIWPEADWKIPFNEVNSTLIAKGVFKTGLYTPNFFLKLKVLELPLQADVPFSMLIFTTVRNDIRDYFLIHNIIREGYFDFNAISDALKEEEIEVKLPEFFIRSHSNATHFFEHSRLFGKNNTFDGILSTAASMEITNILHNAVLKVDANGIGNGAKTIKGRNGSKARTEKLARKGSKGRKGKRVLKRSADIVPENVFDVTEQPFFFVIRSEKVVYFMGQHFND